jgi:hypothetical protein
MLFSFTPIDVTVQYVNLAAVARLLEAGDSAILVQQ